MILIRFSSKVCKAALLFLAFLAAAAQAQASKDADGIALVRDDLSDQEAVRVLEVTKPTADFSRAERFEAKQGGAGTSTKLVNRDSFSNFSANLSFEEEEEFKLGNALFRKLWVSSPSSTQASDGLGPLFNARSCQSCHIKDGRGHPPNGDSESISMFLRLARPALNGSALNLPDPIYGTQLQDLAVPGMQAEGQIEIAYSEHAVELADGTMVTLRKPHYGITDLAYGPLHPDTTLSPRVASQMIGLGLIEAIHPADILSLADPEDENSDGISGRAAIGPFGINGETVLGRFGWKAQNPSIRLQSAEALAFDIGISNPAVNKSFGDCTPAQKNCFSYPTGVQLDLGKTEAPDPVLDLITFYSQNLAVPERRDVHNPQVLRGKLLFYESGCISCHTPKFVTRKDAIESAQSFQLIWPYSDFLLHDMGDGLADGQQVGAAGGNEWRTPPLWGIGLTETVSEHTFFLHDGRARNLTEAILWHGGEAEQSKQIFINLSKENREALLTFLGSL